MTAPRDDAPGPSEDAAPGDFDHDWIVVGSGFGGSVSALRLSEKGYSVLVLEQGRRWRAADFPRTNWDLRRWLWLPLLGLRGIQRLTFLPHVSILSGVGVGGGSLVYANTLPVPGPEFFRLGSWAGLADWEAELAPHYATAKRMLGATPNPHPGYGDAVLAEVARDLGRAEHHRPTEVGVWFGEPGVETPDPYFGGEGPPRSGCTLCGACMTGCRHGAKNTLDRNYLYLAEKRGAGVLADTRVTAVRPLAGGGYAVEARTRLGPFRWRRRRFTARRVVLAGGVLGTVELLLRMKEDPDGLPALSPRTGDLVRTNSEALIYLLSERGDVDHSRGIAIGSILHTDDHSHVEPVRYGRGSGFFRLLLLPHAPGPTLGARLRRMAADLARRPLRYLRAWFRPDLARHSTVLLYMRTLDGFLRLKLGRHGWRLWTRGLASALSEGPAPAAFMEEATDLARRFEDKMRGVAFGSFVETLFGVSTTAHILGGACIGADRESGVIGPDHQVHGYEGLYVVDGSAVSANPGVNPSLTITAMAERAMSLVPPKGA